jgi:hypothetical protein
VGVLATIGPDGFPQVTALWFLYDAAAGVVRFSLNTTRQKTKNLRARPAAAFLVPRDVAGFRPRRAFSFVRCTPHRTLRVNAARPCSLSTRNRSRSASILRNNFPRRAGWLDRRSAYRQT